MADYTDPLLNSALQAKMDALKQASTEKLESLSSAAAEKSTELSGFRQPGDGGLVDTVKDIGIKGAQGVVDLGQAVVGLGSLATGGLVGKGMRNIGYDPETTNQILGQYLSKSQQEADRKVGEAQGFVDTIKTSLENPRAIMGSVVESLPGMVAGMGVTGAVAKQVGMRAAMATVEGRLAAETARQAGKTAAEAAEAALNTVAGRTAADVALKGVEGRLIAVGAATEGAQSAGQIADQAQGAGRDYADYALPAVAAGVGTAGINLLAGKLIGDAATDIAAGTNTLKGSVIKKIGKEAFSEGVLEEMPQSAQEQVFTNMAMGEQDITKGVGNAAASGFLAGAAMGAGMGGIHGRSEVKQAEVAQSVRERADFQQAVEANAPETFLQEESRDYDPSKAIGVLIEQNRKADTTPEVRAQNMLKAGEVLDQLDDRFAELKKQLTSTDRKEAKAAASELKDLARHKKAAQMAYDGLMAEVEQSVAVKPEEVQSTVAQANLPADQADAQAIDTVINLSMSSGSYITAEQAQTLADNKSNGLSEEQRGLLRSFSLARQMENQLSTMGKVSQEVLNGSDKNVGIAQYRTRIAAAIRAGSQEAADKQLGMLASFAKDHAAKATAARQALAQGPGTQIVKMGNQWQVVAKGTLSQSALVKNGGLAINSEDLVKNISTEAKALEASRREMVKAIGVRFGGGTVQTPGASVQSNASAPAPSAKQLATPVSPSTIEENKAPQGNILPKNNGKDGARLENKSLENVVAPPQKEEILPTKEEKSSSLVSDLKTAQEASTKVDAWNNEDESAKSLVSAEKAAFAKLHNETQRIITRLASFSNEQAQIYQEQFNELSTEAGDDTGGQELIDLYKEVSDYAKEVNKVQGNLFSTQPASSSSQPSAPIAVADAPAQGTAASSTSAETKQVKASQDAQTEQQASAPAVSEVAKVKENEEEQTKEESTEVVDPLGLASQRTPAGTQVSYQQRNLVADYFNQRAGSEDGTQRPLAKMKDFLSAVFAQPGLIKEFLASEGKLTSEQDNALTKFFELAKSWQNQIKKNLPAVGAAEYRYTDLMRFLVNEKGDTAENVKTAIAYAAFTWIAENSSRSAQNTDKEINAILQRDEDEDVSPAARSVLGLVGSSQGVVIQSLGQKAVQALGFKATKDAPLNLQAQLESVMGAHVMKLMLDLGLMKRTLVNGNTMKELTGNPATDEKATFPFLALARNEDLSLVEGAEDIAKAVRGSKGIVDKLFSVEPGLKAPALAPVDLKQKTTKSGQEVPATEAKLVNKENAAEHRLNTDMWDLVNLVSEDQALLMAGAQEVDPATVHKSRRAGLKAKNDGLVRELQRAKEFFGGLADKAQGFFFEHDIWKQQRVGILTNLVNPQTSKIHRQLVYRPEWESTIDVKDTSNFLLRVAEGLGVKTDKQSNEVSLAKVNEMLAQPVFTNAIDALVKQLNQQELTEADKQAIVDGTLAGGENFHSLASLMAVARYQDAMEKGENSFTVQLMGEVDGVTNGPMLSHLLNGAAESVDDLFNLLNKGGFYQLGSSQDQYNLWRAVAGNMDLYETTTSRMLGNLRTLAQEGVQSKKGKMLMAPKRVQQILPALQFFTGNLGDETKVEKAGRDIIKTPLTAMVFGSSTKTAVGNMTDRFIEAIYSKIEEVAVIENATEQEEARKELIYNLQTLGLSVNAGAKVEQLMENTFSEGELAVLKKAFSMTIGTAVKTTIDTHYRAFLDQRTAFNQLANVTYQVYKAAHDTIKQAYLQELIESGEIATRDRIKDGKPTGQKVILHDMNKAQKAEFERRLAGLKPVLPTAFSQESKQPGAGLMIANTDRVSSEDPHYTTTVHFGSKFSDNGAASVLVHSYEQTLAEPGVAMAPMSVHSTDGFISIHAGEKVSSLNIHDARGTGVNQLADVAKALNESTWQAMLQYSPSYAMAESLVSVAKGYAALLERSGPELQAKLKDALEGTLLASASEGDGVFDLDYWVHQAYALAHSSTDMKLQALEQMGSINQYALEGGQYVVTESDRKAAAEARTKLQREPSKQDKKVLDKLGTAQAKSVQEPINKTTNTPKTDLKGFFAKDTPQTVQQVAEQLRQMGLTGFQEKLLAAMVKIMGSRDAAVVVRHVTSDTPKSSILVQPNGSAHAWFGSKGGKNEIYLTDSVFENDALAKEAILHEMVHATVAWTIKGASGDTYALVYELKTLMAKAKRVMMERGIQGLEDAVSDVQEFVAWGMTNATMQEVLKSIPMKSQNGSNKWVSGLRAFIDTLVGLVFGKQSPNASSGMEVLITNVTGLFNASKTDPGNMGLSMNLSMASNLNDLTTEQMYDALAAIGTQVPSTGFDGKLRATLENIVNAVHGPYGSFKATVTSTLTSPLDIWADAKVSGKAPFAASVLASGMTFTEQEAFVAEQVEATMRTMFEDKDGSTTAAYRELVRLYDDVRAKLKPSDFPSQQAYDFVFGIALDANNRSTYLSRFVALGMANEQMDKLLDFATPIKSGDMTGMSMSERLHTLFERFMNWIHGKLTHTFEGQEANAKLQSLVQTLVDIEAKQKMKLAHSPAVMLDMVENTFRTAAESGRNTLAKIGQSNFFQQSQNGFVKLTGTIATMVAKDRMDKWADALQTFRDVHLKEKNGLLMGLVNEVRGANAGNASFFKMLRGTKHIEGQRKDLISNTSNFVRESFQDGGKYISKEANAALTATLLRTDVASLLDYFSMDEIHRLVTDPAYLASQVQKFEGQLNQFGKNAMPYRNLSKALAYKLATGFIKHRGTLMNAENIAELYGTPQAGRVSRQDVQAAARIIDPLVSLQALAYSDKLQLRLAGEVLAVENARGNGENGVEMILRQHKFLQEQSRDRLFNTSGALRMKGYVPEIYNPYVRILVADSRTEGQELVAQGYIESDKPLPMDAVDPDKNSHMRIYTLRDGGLLRYQSGIFSNTGQRARGAKTHNGDLGIVSNQGIANINKMAQIKRDGAQDIADLMTKPFDPETAKGDNFMAPLVNSQGEVVNYRYMMNEATKNSLLERDNRFDQVLGAMAGNIFDKEMTAVQNRKAVEALHQQYQQDFATRAGSYTMVGPNSRDPEMREIWRLLPETTKQAIREVWGNNNMMVRIDLLDINFGYRKLSLTDPFGVPADERDRFEKLYVEFFEGLFGKKVAVNLRRIEDVWQALVREAKDTMVVKSGLTLLGNFTSNVSELIWFGVPMTDIIKHHRVALKGVLAYRKDSGELAQLQNRLDTGHLQGQTRAEISHRVNQLKDSLARNPVRELIDAGLMPTIVEDVANEEDQYSFKGRFTRKVDEFLGELNPHVLDAGKLLVMAHDTPLYQIMSYGTQVSDFIARYTLYQHVMNRATDPMDAQTAVQLVSDAFVNYDVPSHRSVQYANDMGLVYFSKYYLRIQKVIALLYRQNPGRALMLLTAGHFLDFLPMLTHSSVLHRFGNPFSMGAFEAIGSLDEMATVNALMTPFR